MNRDPALDALLADYELGGELGRGSFGVVWVARHRQLGRTVAIKELTSTTEADRERFRREARLLARIRHPHVVTVHDFRESDGVRAIVMESLTGGTLDDRSGSLSVEDVVVVGLAAASALQHVHRGGVLHRDMKPANVMFDAEGVVRVTDFGVAGDTLDTVDATAVDLTIAGTLVGTPAFASPEQCAHALGSPWPAPSELSDQYSLAATMYRSLTGELPHDPSGGVLAVCTRRVTTPARPIRQLRPNLPAAVAEVIDRALERAPADRYPTMEQFGLALATGAAAGFGPSWITRSSIELKDPTLMRAADATSATTTSTGARRSEPTAVMPSAPRRRFAAAIGVAAVALLVIGLAAATRWDDRRPADTTTTTATGRSSAAEMPQRWVVATGASVFSSPTVVGDPTNRRVVVGSDDGSVYAIDARSGAVAWSAHTGGPVRSSPLALDDAVVVGSDDGIVRSLALADGSTRWATPLGFEIVSSPRIAGDLVLVGADHLYALDSSTGARRWTADGTGPIVSSPAVVGTTAVVGSEDHTIYGVDTGDGTVRWRLRTGAAVQSSPVIAGDLVVVGGGDGNLYAIDHTSGSLRWSVDLGAAVKSSPTIAGDLVVVGTDAGSVVARRLSDGAAAWATRTADRIDSSPRVVNDRIVVGGNDHLVHVLDRSTGATVATFRTGGPVLSSPVDVDGDVVVGSYDRRVYRVGVP